MKRIVVVLALGLAALLLWAAWPEREAGSRRAPAPAEVSAEPPKPTLEPAGQPLRRGTPADVGPLVEDVTDDSRPDEVAADEPAPGRLRGMLLDSETRLPLAGRRVEFLPVFRRSTDSRIATTDAQGLFELELAADEYLVLHRADPGVGESALPREVAPQRFEMRPAEPGAIQEETFLARRPPGEFEVEVTLADGRPAAGARVIFSCSMADAPLVDVANRTDAAGRVTLGVWNLVAFDDGLLSARDDEGRVSELVSIEAPFVPGLRRLVLGPGAALSIHVRRADGSPAAGRRTLLSHQHELGGRLYRETDAQGRFRFDALFAGVHLLSVWLPESDTWQRQTVELLPGEARELEIVLAVPQEPLAVSGVVLDEEDRPLAEVELIVAVDGRDPAHVRTDETGTFRFFDASGERVWVGADVIQQGDRFEPPEAEADFGADYLLFRRTAVARLFTFEVEVRDRVTGSEVEHFVTTIDRGPGTEAWSDSYAPRRRFELRLLPDARWHVKSHGYLTADLNLYDAVTALEPGERLRIDLDPGLDHAFRVLDADTAEPLPDVRFTSPSAGEARTDARGHVRLRSDHWSIYRITKEGYEPEDWDPDDEVLWGRGPFLLVRS